MDLGDERVQAEFDRMRLHAALEREREVAESYFAGLRDLIDRVDEVARTLGEKEYILRGGSGDAA